MLRSFLTCCGVIFFVFTNVCAAPIIASVGGEILDNRTITISGSSFGTKTTAAPIKWDNFDDGTNNTLLETNDSSWVAYADDGALYTNTYSHSGSLSVYNSTARGEFDTNYYQFTPTDEVYITYWFRTVDADTGDYGIGKLCRITSSAAAGGGGVYNGAGDTILSNMNPRYSSNPYAAYNNGTESITVGYVTVPYNQWVRVEMYKKLSTAGGTDGSVFYRSVGGSEQSDSAAKTRDTGYTFQEDTVLLGLMSANTEGSYQYHIDDVYIDNTQARVELGNYPSFASCSYREIQLPNSWSKNGDSITTTLNTGLFQPGETAYLFVVDSDGLASDGFPVKIGVGLSPPQNVKAVSSSK